MSGDTISRALVLAAGYGKRMRPLTETVPKPLLRLGGKPMLDHVLDRLGQAGVTDAVVNVHYLPEQIEAHLAGRAEPRVHVSDERETLLDTGGAVKKALHRLGTTPFFVHNSDSVWIEHGSPTLARMIETWNPETMDSLLLVAPSDGSLGYSGPGDFHIAEDGGVSRRSGDETASWVFAGVSINHPRLFADCSGGPFSLNRVWDEALAKGRLAVIRHEGQWMHVGTPEALDEAERRLNGLHAA